MNSPNNVNSPMFAVDLAVLRDMLGDDLKAADKFIRRYMEHSSRQIVELGAALEARDWRTMTVTAHKLKSSSRMVGALGLGKQCEALEDQSMATVNKPGVAVLEQLSATHRLVCADLEQILSEGKL